jgi:hypothetical protein
MEFHRNLNDNTWHCCINCSRWPANSYNILRAEKLPDPLKLCDLCKTLQDSGQCVRFPDRAIGSKASSSLRIAVITTAILAGVIAAAVLLSKNFDTR